MTDAELTGHIRGGSAPRQPCVLQQQGKHGHSEAKPEEINSRVSVHRRLDRATADNDAHVVGFVRSS